MRDTKPTAAQSPLLTCDRVWKVFGPGAEMLSKAAETDTLTLAAAVRDVSLSVSQGEIFCIMGLSGSGKSTLVRCMTGLVPPTRGAIDLLGTNITKAGIAELRNLRREKISMVFQDFALLPHLTVLENVAFPLRVRGHARRQREDRAREMVTLVGLGDRESYYPHELSGGQQQRVGIARSLTTDPQVWFLDEPFSALDPLIRQDMQDELLRLQSILHKTIVFITHDFDEAIRLASRIAIMRDGEVVQVATPEDLVLNPVDDYVARFTSKVALADVMTVRTAMTAASDDTDGEILHPSARIRDVAIPVLDAGHPLAVADDAGRVLGELKPGTVIDILAERHKRP
ncbi:glycine betaine/proline transport system ATP-binding protein [Rhodoligotrophos appendicifer]|uniref:quaternary amine ABC transporter ATP-binding protein n=1 Tax=Rhodoligotrophos appendicifer TaxID=987056 RepID=UPI001186B12E|nr:betaine/proline/choline family ABC transporter ATP-binding protein [Rhodoligotrophos appendicifer]